MRSLLLVLLLVPFRAVAVDEAAAEDVVVTAFPLSGGLMVSGLDLGRRLPVGRCRVEPDPPAVDLGLGTVAGGVDPDMLIDFITQATDDGRWDELGYAITVRTYGARPFLIISSRPDDVAEITDLIDIAWGCNTEPVAWSCTAGLIDDREGLVDGVVDRLQAEAWRTRMRGVRRVDLKGVSGSTHIGADIGHSEADGTAWGLQVEAWMGTGIGAEGIDAAIDWALPPEVAGGPSWEWHPDLCYILPRDRAVVLTTACGEATAALVLMPAVDERPLVGHGPMRFYPVHALITGDMAGFRSRPPLRPMPAMSGMEPEPAGAVAVDEVPPEIKDVGPPEIGNVIETIEELVAPESWDADGVGIEEWNGRLVITQTLPVHAQIEAALRDIESLVGEALTIRAWELPAEELLDHEIEADRWVGLAPQLGQPVLSITQPCGYRAIHQPGWRSSRVDGTLSYRGLAVDLVGDRGRSGRWYLVGTLTVGGEDSWATMPLEVQVPDGGASVIQLGARRIALTVDPAISGIGGITTLRGSQP